MSVGSNYVSGTDNVSGKKLSRTGLILIGLSGVYQCVEVTCDS